MKISYYDTQPTPPAVKPRKADRLYAPGTRIIFVRLIASCQQLKVAT